MLERVKEIIEAQLNIENSEITAQTRFKEDLNVDSSYNTRKNTGLPAGPISNPGEASFRAALYPETHNYLYYILNSLLYAS